ncbi:methylated-DNA--protein-cysteine methyltransferase [Sorex araneus]|uniref:methylated-DNA--protein-cysteine methyltransferase n=1 Tax=Sorex araneus TaxID=42254 RepID=UPI0024338AE5|nr:methylated-DNA--protein-cysteine methyltransferase [Sorex araneus]
MDRSCTLSFLTVDSPLGPIQLSGCERGLHEIQLPRQGHPGGGPVAAPAPPKDTPTPLEQCAAWLHAYFREPAAAGLLPCPALHHPLFLQGAFAGRVLRKLQAAVGPGEVVSYQQLAVLAGSPKAARAVGNAMRNNPVPILFPCHRVVCSSGAVGRFSGGCGVKEWLLAHEGSLAELRPGGKGAPLQAEPAGTRGGMAHPRRGSKRAEGADV